MTDKESREKALSDGWKGLAAPLVTSLVKDMVEVWHCKRWGIWVWCRALNTKGIYSNHAYFHTLENAINNKYKIKKER